ncbi:MAG: 4-hydroxy-tetrahydrodipicolinate reductase [Oscillospiraceae bacterium]|nr:4-hydroxy-tetrahydrodipicolinate reductase [Ruminococcus sp.]MBP1564641.1 4-hydroxy-tetrahydrodipicolinate reductase [Oscillospiraceae bacterium]MBQ9982096.1 4-hydroxy-tetrahydrodipicolinate reductase [Oscillospiraceae bacterium]MBR6598961.1 4-hydroxy-tetrahydrodipicolinate reductase [Oscillospiraceae bacterium]
MTNIVICGANGKMGKMIYSCVSEREDCKVIGGIDVFTESYADFPIVSLPSELPEKPDVIIDYSNPASLDNLLSYCLTNGVPVVLATTGYNEEQMAKITAASSQIPVFFSWNMSMGINLLVELSKKAAAFLGEQFDIEIIEKHHNQKIDAPSGTALMIANGINETFDNTKQYVYDRHSQRKKREKKEIGIHAVRGGTIVGEHEVIFAGKDEVITLSHSAASRSVFAVGSINAAVFIKNRTAGIYDMSDVLKEL